MAGDLETQSEGEPMEKVVKTDEEWRAQLTEDQFRIARKGGTERAFGPYYKVLKKSKRRIMLGESGVLVVVILCLRRVRV